MPAMNVMDAVVKIMEDEGVEVVFGIPGVAILPLYKSLSKSEQIRHYSVRHEEGGTHAADAYARVTGKVGANIGTSGPAGTNMITGLYTAQADSIPIICITGQAPTNMLHKEAFQAVDIVEIAKPVTKWAVQVKEWGQLTWTFREAFRIAREGRPGPVLVDLPLDVTKEGMETEIEFDPRRGGSLVVEKPAPNPNAIEEVVEMILGAERPVLMPGGGAIIADASEELVELAEYLQVPVSPTFLMEEIAVAVQYRIPYLLIMVNNGYMSLIRQPEKYQYEMDYGVDIFYEGPNDSVGMDHVGVMEAMGALGRKARRPEEIIPALEWAVRASEEQRVPALVEVLVERDTDAAMGLSIDNINEFEPTEDRTGAMVGGIPERD
jgi:glyoxylate carboligase